MWRWLFVAGALACGNQRGATPRDARDAIAWQPPVEIAQGGGEKGPWQQNESRFDYVDDPTVAIAPDGAAVIAWVDQRRKDVLLQIYDAGGRSQLAEPVNVSRTPTVFSWLPRVAIAPQDPSTIYVAWQEIVFSGGSHGGDIFFARSRDGGRSFEESVNLSRSIEGDGKGRITAKRWHNGSLDLAVAGDGTSYVAWTNYEGQLWLRRSRDGREFEPSVLVANDTQHPARAPALAVSAQRVHLAWTVGETDAADVRVATSADGATFAAPVIVGKSANYSDAPKLALDTRGMLHLAYSETSGGPFDRADVVYTRSRDGKTFEPLRVLSRPHAYGVRGAAFPTLAVDDDQVAVTWESYPRVSHSPHGLGIAYSRDGGATFTPPTTIAGTTDAGSNGSHQGQLMRKLALRDGALVVVNSALRPGELSRVWFVRGRLPALQASR
jgi:hypothetical protein